MPKLAAINNQTPQPMQPKIKIILLIIPLLLPLLPAAQEIAPFSVLSLFSMNKPENLGLSYPNAIETYTVFAPDSSSNKYNHSVVLHPYRDMLYAQWQSSNTDEDAPDTHILYSSSSDGKNWSRPVALTNANDSTITTSGGWWSYADTLVAFICVWPNKSGVKEGYTMYTKSTDGIHWSTPKPVTGADGKPVLGIIEQDIHALPNKRLITAFHMQPGLIAKPFYTDNAMGTTGWISATMENLPHNGSISREIEPSLFFRSDGAIVMIFRDQSGSFRKLASVSNDNGITWSQPVLINTPDSRAKQSAGNLPNGTAFMVNNPSGNKNRFPLVITLSPNGFVFNKAYLIRSGGSNLQPLRYPGKYKREGYSYPKSVIWNNFLYVSYATNKEDVEITRIPIGSLTSK